MPQTLAHHITEIGRVRLGHRVPIKSGKNAGKPRPEHLTKSRLTSHSREALIMAAKRYVGDARPWEVRPECREPGTEPTHRWELFTEADSMLILMQPAGLMHTTFEQWQGGLCVLRCDGQYITHDGTGKLIGH